MLIGTIGPLTDAGLNPARDLGPRLVGLMVGFGNLAFTWDAILIYTIGPLVGGILGSVVYTQIIERMHIKCTNNTDKPCDPTDKHCSHSADEPCDKYAQMMFDAEDRKM